MKKTLLLIALIALMASCAKQEPFNEGWRFSLDADSTAVAPDFDDKEWRVLDLPHDWNVEYETSGVSGVYRKHFKTPGMSSGQRVYLVFDGICWQSAVYVNGKKAGTDTDGCNSFEYDITDLLRSSGDNVLAVAVNNGQLPDSLRNYASGICRNVRLQVLNQTHFKRSAVSIITTDISAETAKINVALSMDGTADCKVQLEVFAPGGDVVATAEDNIKADAVKNFEGVTINDPKFWSPNLPRLYKARLTAIVNGKVVDSHSTSFGLRKLDCDDANGFTLNGNSLKINCIEINHELGSISAASSRRAMQRRLEILREMGCNAVRFTRIRPSEELVSICDSIGLIVLDNTSVQSRDIDEIMDRAGFKKDAFYLCKSQWTDDLVLHPLPHWNWAEGDTVDVIAYTNMKDVELFLNNESLGKQELKEGDLHLMWKVPFKPGELRAVGHSFDDIEISGVLRTAGKPARLASNADRYYLASDGQDLSFVTVDVVDAKGVRVPDANNKIKFTVEGPAEIVAVDNGDQCCHESFHGTQHSAFNGKCLCIIRSVNGKSGRIVVRSTAAGLEESEVEIFAK